MAFGSLGRIVSSILVYTPFVDILIRTLEECDGNIVLFMNTREQGLTDERVRWLLLVQE